MKKSARKSTKKTAKPAAKAKTAKASSAAKKTGAARRPAKSDVGTYTPQPIQGMGWAPFRYPLQ